MAEDKNFNSNDTAEEVSNSTDNLTLTTSASTAGSTRRTDEVTTVPMATTEIPTGTAAYRLKCKSQIDELCASVCLPVCQTTALIRSDTPAATQLYTVLTNHQAHDQRLLGHYSSKVLPISRTE